MKIAIFTQRMDGRATGTALYTSKLVENLINLARGAGDKLFLVHREKSENPLYDKAHEILLPRIRLPRLANFFAEALFLWKTRNDFDIIHYPEESIYPLFWLSRAKIIMTVHSGVEGWKDFGILRRRWWLIWFAFTFFKNRISYIICVSNSTKNSIQKFFNIPEHKIKVIYSGVDARFFLPLDQHSAQKKISSLYGVKAPFILNIARIDPHKNLLRLIEAYFNVRKKHNIPHYLVLGAKHWGPEVRRVDDLIKKLDLKDRVIFLPYIKEEDLPALYRSADLLAFPSLHEGFGLPILEAMAAGTPVFASNVFAMPEISGGAARLINPYDIDEMAEGMWKILSDEKYRSGLIEKGRLRAKEFNWEKTAEETAAVYHML